jgi:GT2 family glycosyltransferase
VARVDVLIPTLDRPGPLTLTLAGVAAQTLTDLRVIVADQSSELVQERPEIATAVAILRAHGREVEWHRREFRHGVAEQRAFLLAHATAEHVLMLDDDVSMEPWVLTHLDAVLTSEGIGFVGAFPAGLSYLDDHRPADQAYEAWDGPVRPEVVEPDGPAWRRARLHGAANVFHAARALPPGVSVRYKVAWVGACALYDRAKLEAVGGFDFWRNLPPQHAGEEVVVQNLLLRRWGGCAILPSGTYHAEAPTTIDEAGRVPNANALTLLEALLERQHGDAS